jgi:hypothetical protein
MNDAAEKATWFLTGLLGGFVLNYGFMVVEAYVLIWLWFWFAVPLGMPIIGPTTGFGIILIGRLVIPEDMNVGLAPTDDDALWRTFSALVGVYARPLVFLGVGYLAKLIRETPLSAWPLHLFK